MDSDPISPISPISQRIEQLIGEHKVVLFMKGTRDAPECGFSARAAEVLQRCGAVFSDVDVQADAALREGLERYSNWPTFPQTYVDGQLIGGSDVLIEMFNSGQLQSLLGLDSGDDTQAAPAVTVSAAAAAAFADVAKEAEAGEVVRFEVNPSFRHALFLGPKRASDHVIECPSGLELFVSRDSAPRADGVSIDFVNSALEGVGFKIDNPNEPAGVNEISPAELKKRLDGDEPVVLVDVRGREERQRAGIASALALDTEGQAQLASLPKDAHLVFFCHHGLRSRAVAGQHIERGHTNVHNLSGGIDAWSLQIDSDVPRY